MLNHILHPFKPFLRKYGKSITRALLVIFCVFWGLGWGFLAFVNGQVIMEFLVENFGLELPPKERIYDPKKDKWSPLYERRKHVVPTE